MASDPFEFGPEERGFEPVFEGETLYSGGETQDATGQAFEQLFQVRESGDGEKFYPQEIKRSPEGQIVGKKTLGRPRQSREEAEESVERRVRNRTAPGFQGFTIGDFVVDKESDLNTARAAHRGRSEKAIRMDKRRRAAITTDHQTYAQNPGRFDYPGVDTPSREPDVLPKDYKYGGKPETREFEDETNDSSSERSGFAAAPEAAAGGSLEDAFQAEMVGRDVPMSPEEFEGVGLGTASAPGGQAYNAIEGRPVEMDRPDQEQEPPETAVERQSNNVSKFLDSDNSPAAVADIYEQGDFDVSLRQFGARVRSEKRRSDAALDLFAAADKVAQEMGAFPAYR